jgi:acyl-CoA reductase-like NAD-dependent aldehyde dehydrogenase
MTGDVAASSRARVTDPSTSRLAAQAARLSDSQAYVLGIFHATGRALADHELVDLATSLGSRFTGQRLRSARAELAARGRLVLVPNQIRKTHSGRVARVWGLPKEAER